MNLFETITALLLSLLTMWWGGSISTVSPTTASSSAAVVSVVDGDTIVVSIDGLEETVRYIGIDTPEPYREGDPECGSQEAGAYNRDLVDGKSVVLVSDREDRDRYDRLLRYVYVDGEMVNERLLSEGLAKPLAIAPNTTYRDVFAQVARESELANRGSWATCGW